MKRLPVYNGANAAVPAYGIMRIDTSDTPEEQDGQVVWTVGKPDDGCESLQEPALLLVNGPVPIEASGYGRGTQDWPVRVQLATGNMSAGDKCGPSSGSWLVDEDRTAFVLLANDVLADFDSSSLYFGWVAPAINSGVIEGTFDSDVTASGNTTVSVAGSTRNITANVPVGPGTSMKWASGTTVFCALIGSTWKVISITACPVAA